MTYFLPIHIFLNVLFQKESIFTRLTKKINHDLNRLAAIDCWSRSVADWDRSFSFCWSRASDWSKSKIEIEIEKALINSFSVRSAIYESIMQLLQFYEEAIADSLSKALHVLLLALYMLVSQSVSQKNLKNFTLSVFLSVYFIWSMAEAIPLSSNDVEM